MEYVTLVVVLIGFAGLAFYLKQPISGDFDQIELKDARITLLEKEAVKKDINISNLNKQLEIAAAKSEGFEQIKIEKARAEERLKIVETERNILKNETISFQKAEEGRQKEANKNFATAVTLQKSLEKEKERLNDVRVKERENQFNKMKLKWSEHEKDVQNHLQIICRNNVIPNIS